MVLVIMAGAAVGVVGGYSLSLLGKTNTKPWELVQPPFEGRTLIRVLAIGEDNVAKGQKNTRGLADTMMVLALDVRNKTVRGVSIPRDTRVSIPGYGKQKINAAYAHGGPELAKQVAEQVLGITIDYYMKTDIDGLKNIVDAVGGVGIEVEKDMHYTDRRGGLKIRLKKGHRHLDGDQAMQYVRFRHDRYGDVGYEIVEGRRVATGRVVRQQKFLRALARQMLQMQNLPKLPSLIGQMYEKGYIETDMSLVDVKAIVKIARDVLPEDMEMDTLPGQPEIIGGGSYWVQDTEQTAEVVNRLLTWKTQTQANMLSVEVLNGTGIDGAAKRVADNLQSLGYRVVSTGNADGFTYDHSRIICRKGVTRGIRQFAELISCTEITEAADGSASGTADITLIVGKDLGLVR